MDEGNQEWFKDWFDQDYALLYAGRDRAEAGTAVAMALDLAPDLARGPVLDLACGGARHLEALRRHNPEAFGLDLSRDLLALAPAEVRPWLIRGDMRQLPFRDGALAGICLWFTPFGYFSDAANRALMERLAALLRPGGALLLDLMNASHVRAHLVAEDVTEHPGLRVHNRRSLEAGRVVKRMRLTRTGTGETREAIESVRLYEPEELRALAAGAGLTVAREVGDYRGAPFVSQASARWIGLLRKP